ncbi:MAG: transporter ATP-binding protein [Burkholderia sp.]|jgi:branched-chain amino acid transport system ATP-binding protein|nr:transporter ATP-binding protein [Burkholderia sp.]
MAHFTVSNLHAHYSKGHVLQGVDFEIARGEIACILGRNGSGRSTTLKALMGIVTPTAGTGTLDGQDFFGLAPDKISRMGIAYVPEDRQVFANLSVLENLNVGLQSPRAGCHTWSLEDMYNYFPRLKERRQQKAGTLSGGEQQMLTMCRSLLGNPKLILIDEPTEGLAPLIVEALREVLIDISRKRVTVLLVEQKLALALKISQKVLVMGHGHIVFTGTVPEFKSRTDVRQKWLDVSS